MSTPLDGQLATWDAAGKSDFDVYQVATALSVPIWQASGWIQDYFRRQGNKAAGKRPALPIHRIAGTRTRNARYHIGSDVPSASDMVHALGSDALCTYMGRTQKGLRAMFAADPATAATYAAAENVLNMQITAFVALVNTL